MSELLRRARTAEDVISTPGTYYDFGVAVTRQLKDLLCEAAKLQLNEGKRYWCSYSTPLASETITVNPPRLVHLENAIVVKDFQHVIVENQCLADRFGSCQTFKKAMASHGLYFGYDSSNDSFNLDRKIGTVNHLEKEIEERETFILLSNDLNDRCFTHWLLGKLPEIMLLRPYLGSIKNPTLVFSYPPKHWQLESLALALHPYNQFKACTISTSTYFKKILMPLGSDQPTLDQTMYKYFRNLSDTFRFDKKAYNLASKLYISRMDADSRRLVNEDAAIPILMDHGFVPLVMTNYSFLEQIAIISNCNTLIMIDGSHGCFGYFLPPNSSVGLIQSSEPGTSPWEMMFNLIGLPTNSIRAEVQNSSVRNNANSDLTICLESLREYCSLTGC